jgi:hypothetical protein
MLKFWFACLHIENLSLNFYENQIMVSITVSYSKIAEVIYT